MSHTLKLVALIIVFLLFGALGASEGGRVARRIGWPMLAISCLLFWCAVAEAA